MKTRKPEQPPTSISASTTPIQRSFSADKAADAIGSPPPHQGPESYASIEAPQQATGGVTYPSPADSLSAKLDRTGQIRSFLQPYISLPDELLRRESAEILSSITQAAQEGAKICKALGHTEQFMHFLEFANRILSLRLEAAPAQEVKQGITFEEFEAQVRQAFSDGKFDEVESLHRNFVSQIIDLNEQSIHIDSSRLLHHLEQTVKGLGTTKEQAELKDKLTEMLCQLTYSFSAFYWNTYKHLILDLNHSAQAKTYAELALKYKDSTEYTSTHLKSLIILAEINCEESTILARQGKFEEAYKASIKNVEIAKIITDNLDKIADSEPAVRLDKITSTILEASKLFAKLAYCDGSTWDKIAFWHNIISSLDGLLTLEDFLQQLSQDFVSQYTQYARLENKDELIRTALSSTAADASQPQSVIEKLKALEKTILFSFTAALVKQEGLEAIPDLLRSYPPIQHECILRAIKKYYLENKKDDLELIDFSKYKDSLPKELYEPLAELFKKKNQQHLKEEIEQIAQQIEDIKSSRKDIDDEIIGKILELEKSSVVQASGELTARTTELLFAARAIKLTSQGHFLSAYSQVVQLYPENAGPWIEKIWDNLLSEAEQKETLQDPDPLLKQLKLLSKMENALSEGRLVLADKYLQDCLLLKDQVQTLEYLTDGIKLKVKNKAADALLKLASAYFDGGKYDKASDYFAKYTSEFDALTGSNAAMSEHCRVIFNPEDINKEALKLGISFSARTLAQLITEHENQASDEQSIPETRCT